MRIKMSNSKRGAAVLDAPEERYEAPREIRRAPSMTALRPKRDFTDDFADDEDLLTLVRLDGDGDLRIEEEPLVLLDLQAAVAAGAVELEQRAGLEQRAPPAVGAAVGEASGDDLAAGDLHGSKLSRTA